MDCSDFARNDTVESAQRSKPCFSSLHSAFLLLLIVYSGQQCAKAGIQAAHPPSCDNHGPLDSRLRNGMDAPSFKGINVPKWERLIST